jgi:hypothetical protein
VGRVANEYQAMARPIFDQHDLAFEDNDVYATFGQQ